MCGFVGAVGLDAEVPEAVRRRVLSTIRHRGPDAEGQYVSGGQWLGFRRLSILDLASRADQPMAHPSGVHVVFNGEIYNFAELRTELEAKGHTFSTTGDTEVLLAGYVEWGEHVFAKCNGMWAVAILDPKRDGVLLARDRFGEKPLHIGKDDDGAWWFGSEPTALRDAGVGSGQLDLDAAAGLLYYGDTDPGCKTWFEGIEQVPAGHIMALGEDGTRSVRPYWTIADEVERAARLDPVTDDEIRASLTRSVELRLRSDVSVGTSLSGGVDSTSVVACIRQVDPNRTLHAFTASFPGQPGDEFDRAAEVAKRYGVEIIRIVPTVEDFLGDLDQLVRHQGAPFDVPSVHAQWCVMRSAHAHGVTVLLDGQGADETWGGYSKYASLALAEQLRRGNIAAVRAAMNSPHGRTAIRAGLSAKLPGYLLDPRCRDPLLRVLRRQRRTLGGAALEFSAPADPIGDKGASTGPLGRAQVGDIGRSILPRLLRYADRNSMAWSREVRLPFLDPHMVELGLRSAWSDSATTGWTKHQLRRAMDPLLPKHVLWNREKSAFAVPEEAWLRHPKLRDQVAAARRHLVELELVAAASADKTNPWSALSLSRLIDIYRLSVS